MYGDQSDGSSDMLRANTTNEKIVWHEPTHSSTARNRSIMEAVVSDLDLPFSLFTTTLKISIATRAT
jgi:hypothetical protein